MNIESTLTKFDLIFKYIKLNGVKINQDDLITYDDDDFTLISKFNKIFNIYFEFSCGDSRDRLGFEKVNNEYITKVYNEYIKNKEIETDDVIQNMLYLITDSKIGIKYCFPKIILNIIFFETDINNNIKFEILNINGDKIFDTSIQEISSCKIIYENIINNNIFKSKYKLYEKNQLVILYKMSILPNENKSIKSFIDDNNINIINTDI